VLAYNFITKKPAINDYLQETSSLHRALTVIDKVDSGREPAAQFPWQHNNIHLHLERRERIQGV